MAKKAPDSPGNFVLDNGIRLVVCLMSVTMKQIEIVVGKFWRRRRDLSLTFSMPWTGDVRFHGVMVPTYRAGISRTSRRRAALHPMEQRQGGPVQPVFGGCVAEGM